MSSWRSTFLTKHAAPTSHNDSNSDEARCLSGEYGCDDDRLVSSQFDTVHWRLDVRERGLRGHWWVIEWEGVPSAVNTTAPGERDGTYLVYICYNGWKQSMGIVVKMTGLSRKGCVKSLRYIALYLVNRSGRFSWERQLSFQQKNRAKRCI